MLARCDVFLIDLVSVCFTLKGDAAVGALPGGTVTTVCTGTASAVEGAANELPEEHKHVEYVESDDGQLLLLLPMNGFVIDGHGRDGLRIAPRENPRADGDGHVCAEWDDVVLDDCHLNFKLCGVSLLFCKSCGFPDATRDESSEFLAAGYVPSEELLLDFPYGAASLDVTLQR